MTHETENEFSERSIPQTAKEFTKWFDQNQEAYAKHTGGK